MRDFCKISPKIWHEKAFKDLAGDDRRLLYLYLLTSAHQNSSGCCRLPSLYGCADLNWKPEPYNKALKALIDSELVLVDDETSEVLIIGWFIHNAPQNEKHKIGTLRLIERIQSERLRDHAHQAFEVAWKEFVETALQRGLQRNQRPAPGLAVATRR